MNENIKLEPLTEDLNYYDSFRGTKDMTWRLNEMGVTMLAIRCGCGQWWGWHYDKRGLDEKLEEFLDNGCGKCGSSNQH